MKSGTALVINGVFFHYCHKINSLMALRIHHKSCTLCKQANPDYIQNKIIYTVSDLTTGKVILAFDDEQKPTAQFDALTVAKGAEATLRAAVVEVSPLLAPGEEDGQDADDPGTY